MTVSKLACRAPFDKSVQHPRHFQLIVVFLKHRTHFLYTKVANQSPTMKLVHQRFSKTSLYNAQLWAFEPEPLLDVQQPMSMVWALVKYFLEVLITSLHPWTSSNPSTFDSKTESKRYLLERAFAPLSSFPGLWCIMKWKAWRYLTHLVCWGLSLCWPCMN